MDRIDVDLSELKDFERDLADIPKGLMRKAEQVVSKGALNIKRGWTRRWEGHSTIAHLPRAVNYDVGTKGNVASAEIGPDPKRLQGPLAHIIEFANAEYGNLRNAPIPGGQPALDEEEPRFVRAVEDLGEEMVKRAAR